MLLLFPDGNVSVGVTTELIQEVKKLKDVAVELNEAVVKLRQNNTGLTQEITQLKGT